LEWHKNHHGLSKNDGFLPRKANYSKLTLPRIITGIIKNSNWTFRNEKLRIELILTIPNQILQVVLL